MSDFEIEYLDEDADLVQFCVKGIIPQTTENKPYSLLSERDKSSKLKRKHRREYEDDEDYHPSKNKEVVRKKRKLVPAPKVEKAVNSKSRTPVSHKKKSPKTQTVTKQRERIQLPDYLDGLCLSQKPYNSIENLRKVILWNKICVDAHNKCDMPLQPDKDGATDIAVSKVVTVFRKVKNKISGKMEHTIWTKTQVENKQGKMNSIVNQGVLPNFSLDDNFTFKMFESNKRTGYKTQTSVVLSKEGTFKDPILQVYQPDKKTCTIFKTVEKTKYIKEKKKTFRYLEEQTSDLVCVPCYQYSWNDVSRQNKASVPCEICGEQFTSSYSMLIHLKIHDDQQVRKLRSSNINKSLPKLVVGHNTMCRVCQKRFNEPRHLKRHLLEHEGKLLFKCSLGNHVTR